MKDVVSEIREFIMSTFPLARKIGPQNDESLFEKGVIDSLGVVEVITFIVENYKIDIGDNDLMPENFTSIQSIANFVQQKKKQQSDLPDLRN